MAYQTAAAREEFDRWSHRYDHGLLQRYFFEPAHRMLLEAIGTGATRILDIGCGTGIFASLALEHLPEAQVWGLDLSSGMLAQTHERLRRYRGRLHLVQGDSQRLPFDDNAFDAVTCSHSFHHYPNQDRVIAEMYRALRPGGKLLIIDGDRDRLWGRLVFDVCVVWIEGPVRHLTSQAFRAMYAKTGFVAITQQRRGGPLPFVLTQGLALKPEEAGGRRKAA